MYTVFFRILAAATINFSRVRVRLLIEGGSYSRAALINFLFYCEFYQKTKEYQDFVLEFGLNRAEVKLLPAEERWNRIWQSNDTKSYKP